MVLVDGVAPFTFLVSMLQLGLAVVLEAPLPRALWQRASALAPR